MNIKEYISSGILELYVLGLLSPEENQEVNRMIEQYPELQSEVLAIEKTVKAYADNLGIKPRPGVEQDILQKVGNVEQVPAANRPSASNSETSSPTKTAGFRGLNYLLAALFAGALVSTIYFYNQVNNTNTQLEQTQQSLAELQQDCDEKDTNIQQLSDQLDLLLNPANRRINLNGTDNAPQALASVFYNTAEQKTYLDVGNLAAPPEDRFYQLWALVDGNPVDMGEFEVITDGDSLIIEVPYIVDAGAFAITLEPRDGDPAPNLDELQVIGTVG